MSQNNQYIERFYTVTAVQWTGHNLDQILDFLGESISSELYTSINTTSHFPSHELDIVFGIDEPANIKLSRYDWLVFEHQGPTKLFTTMDNKDFTIKYVNKRYVYNPEHVMEHLRR